VHEDWLERRLQGTIRLTPAERKPVSRLLTTPKDEGGEGLSQREAAKVLGVAQKTVDRDVSESNDSPEPESDPVPTTNEPDGKDDLEPTEPEDDRPLRTPFFSIASADSAEAIPRPNQERRE